MTAVNSLGRILNLSVGARLPQSTEGHPLFFGDVWQVELKAAGETVITVRRQEVDSLTHMVRLASSEGVTNWTVIERDSVALAFVHDETGIARLEERQAVVHAFLPTLEATGFPFKVNGDVST